MKFPSLNLRGFRFSDLKLANQITLIAGVLAVAILAGLTIFAGYYSSQSMTAAAERDFKAQVDNLRRTADLAYKLSEGRTNLVSTEFEREFKSQLTVDSTQTVRVGDTEVPVVKLGDSPLSERFSEIDRFAANTGTVATIFARRGDDFVRVLTTLKDEKGERPLGTLLGKDHPAYRGMMNGDTYLGPAKLFGKQYMTKYLPVRGKGGSVAAVLFVGLDQSNAIKGLLEVIKTTKFGESGYAYVADLAEGSEYGKFIVHPSLEGKKLHELVDGDGKTGTLKPILEEKSGLFSYMWFNEQKQPDAKFVAFDRSELWNWVIAGGTQREEITRSGTKMARIMALAGLGGAIVLVALLWPAIARRMKPLAHLRAVVLRLAEGDDEARARLDTKDEVGELGAAFDRMMDERVAAQSTIARENEQLNTSVLGLLQAVAQLSRKDLTVKVPVTEDVTGAVADALNLLTNETGKVLLEVSNISAEVTAASLKVKEQADNVMAVAQVEREEVAQTADSLAAASASMNQIAELARVCNDAADNAIKTTQRALQTVTSTVGGINSTRDIIRETEKRIKRLGERSQEISGVVNLINTIAERTHILALNASMHAASAGEAGRGFAVVADEVQRLAESARQATAQIATLVNNIQVETADTVNTMNAAITQVVEGSKLAEQAGEQMQNTQASTAELVSLVQKIAASSEEQARVSSGLLDRASEIRKSSEQTSQRLEEQGQYTNNLVEYARSLLSTVRVFKLPA